MENILKCNEMRMRLYASCSNSQPWVL